MRRKPSALLTALAISFAMAYGLPGHAATSCAAANPNTTSVIESTPTSDFTINGNGTVTHTRTGLVWKQCPEGKSGSSCGSGVATTMTWANALKAANDANAGPFAGYSDWRLPNVKELQSIVETCGFGPAINTTVFPATPAAPFWTGSSLALATLAWDVAFANGNTVAGLKTATNNVRLVRGGRSSDSFDALGPTANVLYNGNGSTGGSVPIDGAAYSAGAAIVVAGNTGGLVKTSALFAGWSVAQSGGVVYAGGATLPIVGDITLNAQWNSAACTLDVDGNSSIDALTDGLVIIRAMFGLTGTAVTNGAIGGGTPTRSTWAQIQPYLNGNCGTNFAP